MTPGPERTAKRSRYGRRKSDKIVALLAIAVIVLLFVCAVISFVAVTTASNAQDNTKRLNNIVVRLDAVATASCERLQRLRDDENAQANNQYDVIKVAAEVASDPRARARYREFVKTTPYSPPTDCARASRDPLGYSAPATVPFAEVDACYSAKHSRIEPPCGHQR